MLHDSHNTAQLWPIGEAASVLLVYLLAYKRRGGSSVSGLKNLHIVCFLSGTSLVFAVIASPLAEMHHRWLAAHMLQHLVLMTLAAPLILLGQPIRADLNSRPAARVELASAARRCFVSEGFCWLAGTVCVLFWHIPHVFALSMQSAAWHRFELGSFLVCGLMFWSPVIQGWSGGEQQQWILPLYLFLATLPCDALSAFLVFYGQVVYVTYAHAGEALDVSVLGDQQHAGAMMWVWVTFAYLVPAVVIAIRILSPTKPPKTRVLGQPLPRCKKGLLLQWYNTELSRRTRSDSNRKPTDVRLRPLISKPRTSYRSRRTAACPRWPSAHDRHVPMTGVCVPDSYWVPALSRKSAYWSSYLSDLLLRRGGSVV